jgi:hypothetical protein
VTAAVEAVRLFEAALTAQNARFPGRNDGPRSAMAKNPAARPRPLRQRNRCTSGNGIIASTKTLEDL